MAKEVRQGRSNRNVGDHHNLQGPELNLHQFCIGYLHDFGKVILDLCVTEPQCCNSGITKENKVVLCIENTAGYSRYIQSGNSYYRNTFAATLE